MKFRSSIFSLLLLGFILNSCSWSFMYYYPDKEKVVETEEAQDVYIKFKKDKQVHGIFYPLKNPTASVFILHGNAGSLGGWKSVAAAMRDEGYQAFIFDYPGFGNSDGKPRHGQVIEASQAAFDYFKSRPEVQGTKKFIIGFSLGANLALKIGPDNQDELDAMVIEGCFNNYERIAMDRTPKIFRWFTWMAVGNKFKGDKTIQDWNKPFLVVHSTEDKVCPYWMGEDVYNKAGSSKKELWTIEGPHIRGFALYKDEYYDKIYNLLQD